MPARREVLDLLKRNELLSALDAQGLEVEDRRRRDGLVAALAADGVDLTAVLLAFPRARLKELCRTLGLDDSGRAKVDIVARLLASSSALSTPSTGAGAAGKARKKAGRKPRKAKAGEEHTGSLGFEQKLWDAADLLRNNMDPAEYWHVVLGLLFLKYIEDAFQERRGEIRSAVADGVSGASGV